MSGFKLIAIRPLVGCDSRFLKNLKAGEIYRLYNDFEFTLDDDNMDVLSIRNKSQVPNNLFGKNINVSAIVGKNGSGKSTLVEIFNNLIFNLSVKLDLINIEKFKKEHSLNIIDIKKLENELFTFEKLNCEIFYQVDNEIYLLCKNENKIYFKKFESNNLSTLFKVSSDFLMNLSIPISHEDKVFFLYNSFFYTIGANYSLYGLNTTESGIWLKSIFHKNDGYQTPIVLNPMRTDGIIDINRLTYLSKSRLLSNIFRKLEKGQKAEDSLRNIVNNKIIQKLILNLDLTKFEIIDPENLNKKQSVHYTITIQDKFIYLKYTESLKAKYFELILNAFHPNISIGNIIIGNNILKKITVEYILRKTETIIKKYPEYEIFSKSVFRTNAKNETIKACFEELANDFSHITFKLRQAINFLIFDFYEVNNKIKYEFLITNNDKDVVNLINLKLEELKKNELKKLDETYIKEPDLVDIAESSNYIHNKYALINFLPPSFFEIDLEFKDKGLFKDLSSGEKQIVYSLSSIIYHLINLKSIHNDERISYNKFNLILDEIELYFHPEFQRKFLSELLKSINNSGIDYNGINILFLTHSPFILSDIPSQNILKLEDGDVCLDEVSENTFGANIHDLLANDFFLKDGFMGEFAKSEINNVISFLAREKNKNEIIKIEDLIKSLNLKLKKEDLEKHKIIEIEQIRSELKKNRRNKLIKKIDFDNLNEKYNSKYCSNLIDIIGEPMLYNSLVELYTEAYPLEKENFIKRQIERLQKLIEK